MAKEMEVEHLLLMLLGAYLVYHFMGRCSCGDGFSVSSVSASYVYCEYDNRKLLQEGRCIKSIVNPIPGTKGNSYPIVNNCNTIDMPWLSTRADRNEICNSYRVLQ
tara:strand:- start:2608 stop:2925 length:318 start_codon:yes stop_codon:yes gene_type:complete